MLACLSELLNLNCSLLNFYHMSFSDVVQLLTSEHDSRNLACEELVLRKVSISLEGSIFVFLKLLNSAKES